VNARDAEIDIARGGWRTRDRLRAASKNFSSISRSGFTEVTLILRDEHRRRDEERRSTPIFAFSNSSALRDACLPSMQAEPPIRAAPIPSSGSSVFHCILIIGINYLGNDGGLPLPLWERGDTTRVGTISFSNLYRPSGTLWSRPI